LFRPPFFECAGIVLGKKAEHKKTKTKSGKKSAKMINGKLFARILHWASGTAADTATSHC